MKKILLTLGTIAILVTQANAFIFGYVETETIDTDKTYKIIKQEQERAWEAEKRGNYKKCVEHATRALQYSKGLYEHYYINGTRNQRINSEEDVEVSEEILERCFTKQIFN